MIEKIKNKKGITLIALVITIIVLLILAGVAISMLSGENGILNQAVKAKEKTEKKSIEESVRLATLAAMTNTNHGIEEGTLKNELNGYFGENGYTMEGNAKDGWTVEVNENSYLIENTGNIMGKGTVADIKGSNKAVEINTIAEDTNGDKMVIPENFNIAEDSPTKIEEGIVIEDSQDNQYVWIPVFEKSTSRDWGIDYKNVTNETDYTKIEEALKAYTATYKDGNCSDVWYGDDSYGQYGYYDESDTSKTNLIYYTNGNMTQEQYTILYHNMLKSVYKNGGFYIGRYEMGTAVVKNISEAQKNLRTETNKEYKADSSTPSINEKTKIGAAPVSKSNAVPYNYITQSQAEMLAEKLGQEADYSNVYTSIMFGVQWDAVCVFIEKCDTNEKKPTEMPSKWLTDNNYGILWGNYNNSEYTMDRGFYNLYSDTSLTEWKDKLSTPKPSSELWLCTTGASEQNKSLNIYDFGGNVTEWTLERYISENGPCTCRGGYFNSNLYAFFRSHVDTCHSTYNVSSRSTLYIK